MKTLQEHLDDLDRMVDSGLPPKHEIRSQISFIGREVAALEDRYARLADAHTKLQDAHKQFNKEQAEQFDAFLKREVDKEAKLRKKHSLNYDAENACNAMWPLRQSRRFPGVKENTDGTIDFELSERSAIGVVAQWGSYLNN